MHSDGARPLRYAKKMSAWLCPLDPAARLHLICLPSAGGGANDYRGWPAHLPAGVQCCPVMLPGRETRFREPPLRRMDALLDALADALAEALESLAGAQIGRGAAPQDRPAFALFGHSMGAGIALGLCHELQDRGLPLPERLIVSGRNAPGTPSEIGRPPLHAMPDEEFLSVLQGRYGAIPEVLLRERGLLRMFLPTLRADLELLETWQPPPAHPFPFPIHAFTGTEDAVVDAEGLSRWGRHTGVSLTLDRLPGAHFYLRRPDRTPEPAFMARISARLAP